MDQRGNGVHSTQLALPHVAAFPLAGFHAGTGKRDPRNWRHEPGHEECGGREPEPRIHRCGGRARLHRRCWKGLGAAVDHQFPGRVAMGRAASVRGGDSGLSTDAPLCELGVGQHTRRMGELWLDLCRYQRHAWIRAFKWVMPDKTMVRIRPGGWNEERIGLFFGGRFGGLLGQR